MIYPKDAPGEDPDLYLRIQKKANDIFRSATGTIPFKKDANLDDKKKVPKKKKKKIKTLKKEGLKQN